MVIDVWSRHIIDAAVQDVEYSKLTSDFFDCVCRNKCITSNDAAVLHSGNGTSLPQASQSVVILQGGGKNVGSIAFR